MNRLTALMLLLPVAACWSHGGGLDDHGGHTQRSTGEYHCHREPCLSQRHEAEKATQEAITENRAFTALYDRDDWPHWSDLDGDCLDTRAEVLIRDSQGPVTYRQGGKCIIHAGKWVDPYTGQRWTLASDLDTDHIVPLKWAYQHGSVSWTRAQKERFANDLENLLAVEDNLNQSKGAKGPDKWMPPLTKFHCRYLDAWERILIKYELAYSSKEKTAIQTQFTKCFN